MPRIILHLDLDAFFCAVEEQRDRSLIGKPFAVGGKAEERGVVASCSYAARKFGVHSAMPTARALRLCPDLRIISPRHKDYSDVSRQVMERLRNLTPLIEQISIDEAFIDISDLSEPVEVIAKRLQDNINDELGLPCSIGIASNKMVAKIATDVGKAKARTNTQSWRPPNAITIVESGEEAAFLAPLPVQSLWGVGPKTAQRLSQLGITTIGQLADYPTKELVDIFGKTGFELSYHARGIDENPIVTFHEPKSISNEVTFAHDIRDEQQLHKTLHELSESVGKQLRKSNYSGKTIKIKLRWPNFDTITRQVTLPTPTDQDDQIYAAAVDLFSSAWVKGKAVRLIGVGVSGLGHSPRQLSLWDKMTSYDG